MPEVKGRDDPYASAIIEWNGRVSAPCYDKIKGYSCLRRIMRVHPAINVVIKPGASVAQP